MNVRMDKFVAEASSILDENEINWHNIADMYDLHYEIIIEDEWDVDFMMLK